MPERTIFETKRLVLRPFEPGDLAALRAHLNHPDLVGRRYTPWGFPEDQPLSQRQVENIFNRWSDEERELHLALLQRESQELIGHAEMDWDWDPQSPFVTVVIAPSHQRCSYGSEVLDYLLRYLYQNTPAHNVCSWFADWNQAARDFSRRHGFQESGRSRREGLRNGTYFDGILVDILRPEWLARQAGGGNGA